MTLTTVDAPKTGEMEDGRSFDCRANDKADHRAFRSLLGVKPRFGPSNKF
jgi:hypothetical protein